MHKGIFFKRDFGHSHMLPLPRKGSQFVSRHGFLCLVCVTVTVTVCGVPSMIVSEQAPLLSLWLIFFIQMKNECVLLLIIQWDHTLLSH